MKKKATFWLILWVVLIVIGSAITAVEQVVTFLQTGVNLAEQPYTELRLFLLLIYLPFVLLPLLCVSQFYAVKEKNKTVRIATLCLIIHHVISAVAVLAQVLA